MKTLFRLGTVLVLFLAAVSAQAGDLTRAQAFAELNTSGWFEAQHMVILKLTPKTPMFVDENATKVDQVYKRWLDLDLVRIGEVIPCVGCMRIPGVVSVELTPKGDSVFGKCMGDGTCELYNHTDGRVDIRIKLGSRRLESVTGITQSAPNRATVEFNFLAKLTEVAKAIGQQGGTVSVSVDLVKYDDGWRPDWKTLKRR